VVLNTCRHRANMSSQGDQSRALKLFFRLQAGRRLAGGKSCSIDHLITKLEMHGLALVSFFTIGSVRFDGRYL